MASPVDRKFWWPRTTAKDLVQAGAFALGGYRWWAVFKHRWDDAFPSARPETEPIPGMLRRQAAGACSYCAKNTNWYDTLLKAWICSVECRRMATRALQQRLDELTKREIGHL